MDHAARRQLCLFGLQSNVFKNTTQPLPASTSSSRQLSGHLFFSHIIFPFSASRMFMELLYVVGSFVNHVFGFLGFLVEGEGRKGVVVSSLG
jgi:hypothetical protein